MFGCVRPNANRPGTPLRLADLSRRPDLYPLTLIYHDDRPEYHNLDDALLASGDGAGGHLLAPGGVVRVLASGGGPAGHLLAPDDGSGGHLLRADGLVDDDSVVVARINEFDALKATRPRTACDDTGFVDAEDAFHLPLRTRSATVNC